MRLWALGLAVVVCLCGLTQGFADPDPMAVADPVALADPAALADPVALASADPGRDKRQLSKNINSVLRHMGHSIHNGIYTIGATLDRHVMPRVRYAAERITEDVAPTVGGALLRASNQMALRTAEGLQATAQVVATRIMPAIEDKLVDVGNAAVPYINHGIDAIESGLQRSAQVVSKSTVKGIDQLGMKVLGEQRHNRVKTIANNIQGGISSGINSLAGALNSFNSPTAPVQDPDYYTNQDYHDYIVSQYTNENTGGNVYSQDYSQYHPHYSQYSPDYPHAADSFYHPVKYQQAAAPSSPNHNNRGSGMTKVVDNTAYTISRHILGRNLTNAIAPIAKRVTNALGQTIPAVSFGDGRIVIDLPGSETEKSDKVRSCTTPVGGQGYCKDLSDCPDLILDLTNLRKSVCFKSLFVPGVCCPVEDLEDNVNSINHPPPETSTSRPRPVTPGFRPPPHRPPPTIRPRPTPPPRPIAGSTPRPQPIQPVAEVSPNNDNFQCGVPKIPTFRIVGGKESRRGQWPWMAAIWLHGPKKTEFWCGGSLISSQYILTAAHCTKDSRGKTFNAQQFTVRLGDHNIFSESDDFISNPETYRVSSIRPHPDFKAHGFYNDVALLKLDRPVDFTEYILPVCLPSDEMTSQPLDNMVGRTPSVIGWGSTFYGGHESPALREAQLPIWKNSDCDDAYFQPITEVFLCAGFEEGGSDACQGDSGGPLQLYMDGNWVQIGLVSFGNRCAEPGYPGVYTRITNFMHWIRNNMR